MPEAAPCPARPRPADDQDQLLGSLDFMPLLKEHVTDKGTQFSNFVTCRCFGRVNRLGAAFQPMLERGMSVSQRGSQQDS